MDNLNSIPKSGSYGAGVDLHNDNYQKIGVELQTLRELGQNDKGYFETIADLEAKYPTPQSGWRAYVANVASSTGYYLANVNSSGNWVVTAAEAPPINVDLAGYAKTGGSEKTVKEVEDDLVQLAGISSNKLDKNEIVDDNLIYFADKDYNILGRFDKFGRFSAELSEEMKNEISELYYVEEDFLLGIVDKNNVVVPLFHFDNGVLKTNAKTDNVTSSVPINLSLTSIPDVQSLKPIKVEIELKSTAVGRESSSGAGDAPRIPLTTGGYTHPKVLFVPGGWNGYPYWMAITPTFGIIAKQTDSASYENPHLFCSMDGINWIEPNGLENPIDLPTPADTQNHGNAYWSDTHLEIGNDGYMYLFYRGNNMPPEKIGLSDTALRAVVYRKSKDGVNWSSVQCLYSTNTEGVDASSMIASPALINNGYNWECFDIVNSTTANSYVSQGCTSRAVMRRIGGTLETIGNYSSDSVVNFKSRPWGAENEIWHLDALKVNGTYLLLLACGNNATDIADSLYLAYSADGWNFNVMPTPLFTSATYRSSFVYMGNVDGKVQFNIYQSDRINGSLNLYKIIIK